MSLLHATREGEQALADLERRKSQWLSHALREWDDHEVRQLANLLRRASTDLREAAQELMDHPGQGAEEGAR